MRRPRVEFEAAAAAPAAAAAAVALITNCWSQISVAPVHTIPSMRSDYAEAETNAMVQARRWLPRRVNHTASASRATAAPAAIKTQQFFFFF